MNRDSARKLSDSDFWQICREMHPSSNYTFPVAPMLGVANNDNFISDLNQSVDQRLGFDQHETSEEVSSDDSLQNLYVKKARAHRKLLSDNSNCINTKKIHDTIELFSDEDDDECVKNGENGKSDNSCHSTNHDRHELKLATFEHSELDGIHNADDLLLKIADSVQQLKANVNQIGELNDKCHTGSDAYAVGDLIDFSDDWTNGESDNNSNASDKPIKKVTHSCVQGSLNDGVGNERLPYVKFEERKNFRNNSTGRAVESNETEYDTQMDVNSHRSGVQVNYCNDWHTENGNDYPSPTTSESSNGSGSNGSGSNGSGSSSSCSYTDSLSNSSRSTTSDNIAETETETETSVGHTLASSNSHTLNTEHNRPYEFEQCAHQTQPNDKHTKFINDSDDKSHLTQQPLAWQSNVAAAAISCAKKINIEETNSEKDSSNGACAVHTFVTFTHTKRDNNEVNSSIEPKQPVFGVEKASQDVLTTSLALASQTQAQTKPSPSSLCANNVRIETSIVVTQPKPSAGSTSSSLSSSFIEPLPLDTSTSADSFGLQAEWDADKNNNPLHYKDKRTKALPFGTVETDSSEIINNQCVNSIKIHSASHSNVLSFSASEIFALNSQENHQPNPSKAKNTNLSSASAASTPFFSCDPDNKDENEHVSSVNAKICLRKKSNKSVKYKLKYRKTVVDGCWCEQNWRISVRKPDKFNQKCNKRRGGNQNELLQNCCSKRLKKADRKNRIGKQQIRCNYKWKCCRGHLRDYDLCETFLVTSKCGKTKSSPRVVEATPPPPPSSSAKVFLAKYKCANGVRNSCENVVRKSQKEEEEKKHTQTGGQSTDDTLCVAQRKGRRGDCNESEQCDKVSAILPYSSSSRVECDAVDTSTRTEQSLNAINKTLYTDSTNKRTNRIITATASETVDDDDDNDDYDNENDGQANASVIVDADEFRNTLKLSPPIEKIKQVLDAVKYCDTNLSAVNCDDNNRCAENATKPTKCDDSTDSVTLNANSLKNSLKLSESCDSIFTLKRSASISSSLLSLNGAEPFEASNRLRRLEERFKDFAITSVGKKGRCVSNNLSQSSSTIPTQQQQQQQQHPIQLKLESKGHSDASTEQRHLADASPSTESHTSSVIDKVFAEAKSSHLNDGVISNENECNLKHSDGNNNHINLKTQSNEKLNETKHICCSHTLQKRQQCSELAEHTLENVSLDNRVSRKSPIGFEQFIETKSIERNRRSATSDQPKESIDEWQQKASHPSIDDDDSDEDDDRSVNKFDDSSAAQPLTSAESQESSLKKDSTQHQQIHVANDIEDDKLNPNRKSSTTNTLNSGHLQKIDTQATDRTIISTSTISIASIISIDDNKNNLEQILTNDAKNQSNGFNQFAEEHDERNEQEQEQQQTEENGNTKENSLNANEAKEKLNGIDVQQLDNIANRLINCTPVSISTESEEICNLFPENQRLTNDSPFIYRDEELKTKCIFDVSQLSDFQLPPFDHIYECYDELEDDIDDNDAAIYSLSVNQSKDILNNNNNNNNSTNTDSNDNNDVELTSCDPEQLSFPSNYCQCTIESIVPLYPKAFETSIPNQTSAIMRDMTSSGTLRGLLKKPNRPAPSQKNRVIFDETRNEFFDADYIILVRDDCPYDEEDEEPCTCGEHELVRLCCDEGCQCTAYTDDGRTPQSPKYAPPVEFVDQAALSPPEGYKDGGLQQALGGVLGSHIFGAQHIQQLQVIQRLQAKRAAMLAAQRSNNNGTNQSGSSKNQPAPPPPPSSQTICTECAECTECAAKQEHDEALPHMQLLSIQATSPERRFTQKEIIAGEERPKYLLIKQHQDSVSSGTNATSTEKSRSSKNPMSQRYVVETITMTTVTERRVLHEETNTTNSIIIAPTAATLQTSDKSDKLDDVQKSTTITTAGNEPRSTYLNSDISLKPTSISAQITGILKGGKLWKNEMAQSDETTSSATSDDETSKRSVRFIDGTNNKTSEHSNDTDQDVCDSGLGDSTVASEQNGSGVSTIETDTDSDTLKKQPKLFHNSLRPNSAVRQLFPTAVLNTTVQPAQTLTHEALRAFDESKRSQLKPSIVHSDSETDTIRRTIERNALRRSLIKYEPKKKATKPDTSLEERIRQLTCDVDEPVNEHLAEAEQRKLLERRSSPTGEENPHPQVQKYVPDKSFSPISTASSSSSSSISAYKKITDIFHKDKRQERIPEADENPIVIIPQQLQQDCRCPSSAPDLGLGTHLPNANNQLQSVRPSDARRQFLSTLAPLTACVAGQRDDMSFYSLAAGDRNSTGSSRCSEYSIGDIDAILQNDDAKKVAPDVIAGTPGQEHNDELAAFAQQEATRTERIKKRYNQESTNAQSIPTSNTGSDDDDELNDYGFNHRPSVRGIKPRSNEEMLEQMQTQLSSASVTKPPPLLPRGQSNTLPKASTQSLQTKLMSSMQIQQQPQTQQQIASIVHQQNISTWNAYYQEQAQRNSLPANTPAAYFQHLPIQARHSFHQEESTIYQNCQGVAMEQHYNQSMAARSPTRRPESPPPLRNYHQTMVLIPYNTDAYTHFTADQIAAQQFHQHQNILEYQQVTQQTIRVPIGYPLPGMQLHVVAGNANPPAYAQYATTTRQQTQLNAGARPTYGYIQENQVPAAVKYTERGAPEGAASVTQSDCNSLMPSATNAVQQNNVPVTSTANNTQTSNTSTTAQQGAVFYAMNV